jgi:hypothetical protein
LREELQLEELRLVQKGSLGSQLRELRPKVRLKRREQVVRLQEIIVVKQLAQVKMVKSMEGLAR